MNLSSVIRTVTTLHNSNHHISEMFGYNPTLAIYTESGIKEILLHIYEE